MDSEAVARIHRYVVGAICRMTGEFQTAADLAQDVFVKALGGMDGFRHDARLTTWIYAIARNRCFDYLKERAARREVGGDVLDDVHPLVDNEALRTMERDEARRIV